MSIKVEDTTIMALAELRARMAELQRQLQLEGKKAIEEATKEFFAKNPRARALVWTQYTPYYNDGDPCVFGIGEVYVALNDEAALPQDFLAYCDDELYSDFLEPESLVSDNGDEDDVVLLWAAGTMQYGTLERHPNWEPLRTLFEDAYQIEKIFEENKDVLEAVYGDHVRVILTRVGTDVEEYEHD